MFPANAMVRAFETFDAVSAGVADMYHSYDGYFEKKSPRSTSIAAFPSGSPPTNCSPGSATAAARSCGTRSSANSTSSRSSCLSTGTQMGGWFNNEITSPEKFKGLRYRMPGLGGEVLRQLGAIVVTLPGGEIAPALKSGAIDASEWVGPWQDMAMGLHKAASYYYYPGFHEPGTAQTLGINKRVWESFDAGDQRLIEAVAAGEYAQTLAEHNCEQRGVTSQVARRGYRQVPQVRRRLAEDAFARSARRWWPQPAPATTLSRKIYASYQRFRRSIIDWSDISERAYLNGRKLA